MPNLKGGKKYKAGKHSDEKPELHEIGEGQMVGRIIKNLGDRNLMIYCNDGKERICHIRGSMTKKKCKLEIGDIILFSFRDETRGDILAKYNREVYSQLKKEPGIEAKLFLTIESFDADKRASGNFTEDSFGFSFENESDSEQEEEKEEEEERRLRKTNDEKKRQEERHIKGTVMSGDDIDIDAI
jgi:translation initiation factor 1A